VSDFLPPPPRHVDYVYGAYDFINLTPDPKSGKLQPTLLFVKLSRSEARKEVMFRPDADAIRIRRARLIPYSS
jgi:hypothetical protein